MRLVEDAGAQHGLGVGQLAAVVDAQGLAGVGEEHRLDVATEQREHVGQVVLALGVVVADAGQRRPEAGAVEHVHAGPHLGRRHRARWEVALLDRAHHAAGLGVAVDPAQAARVLRHRGQQRRRGTAAAVVVDEAAERLRPDQRDVAGEDQHLAAVAQVLGHRAKRIAGAARLRLLDALGAVPRQPRRRRRDRGRRPRSGAAR